MRRPGQYSLRGGTACSAPSTSARSRHFALGFSVITGYCVVSRSKNLVPDLDRLARPRPPNLVSQYRPACLSCQAKIAKSGQLFSFSSISSGTVSGRTRLWFSLFLYYASVLNFYLSARYAEFLLRPCSRIFASLSVCFVSGIRIFHSSALLHRSEHFFRSLCCWCFFRGKTLRRRASQLRKSFRSTFSRRAAKSFQSRRTEKTRGHYDR